MEIACQPQPKQSVMDVEPKTMAPQKWKLGLNIVCDNSNIDIEPPMIYEFIVFVQEKKLTLLQWRHFPTKNSLCSFVGFIFAGFLSRPILPNLMV